jgi:hypothetical protein
MLPGSKKIINPFSVVDICHKKKALTLNLSREMVKNSSSANAAQPVSQQYKNRRYLWN